jgi:hypothetical protein
MSVYSLVIAQEYGKGVLNQLSWAKPLGHFFDFHPSDSPPSQTPHFLSDIPKYGHRNIFLK